MKNKMLALSLCGLLVLPAPLCAEQTRMQNCRTILLLVAAIVAGKAAVSQVEKHWMSPTYVSPPSPRSGEVGDNSSKPRLHEPRSSFQPPASSED